MYDNEDDEQNYLDMPEESYCTECGELLSVDQEDLPNDEGTKDVYFCKNC